ncbi:MAG: hypothetical protein EOM90_04740 [Alphaproteobacteria bacterium]|nr:hypothetical protein [Alphaproteobacteria bacterium]
MKVRKESVAELKKQLPHGSAKVIKSRLEKNDRPFTLQYIYRCLNSKRPDFNPFIISEAIKLVRQYAKKVNSIEKRIKKINNASV